MRPYLLFRVYGPMASWGDVAVGEYRPSTMHPSKSAVLGLVGSALGLAREDGSQAILTGETGFASFVERPGLLLRDYHTIQTPSSRKGARYATRRDELMARDKSGAESLNTILSTRDYWTDCPYTLCLWPRNELVRFDMVTLKQALVAPRFPLFLGRRACPLALPLEPQIHSADSILAAYKLARFHSESFLGPLNGIDGKIQVYWDADGKPGDEVALISTSTRRDIGEKRSAWEFSQRLEMRGVISLGGHLDVPN